MIPADDSEQERLNKFKTGEMYEVEMKLTRNPAFHRKMFAFFNFCFEYWAGEDEFTNEAKQKDVFRKNLTALAGFYDSFTSISGEVRIEAKSLAYASMEPEEFETCYNALINAALKHVFKSIDEVTKERLYSFF